MNKPYTQSHFSDHAVSIGPATASATKAKLSVNAPLSRKTPISAIVFRGALRALEALLLFATGLIAAAYQVGAEQLLSTHLYFAASAGTALAAILFFDIAGTYRRQAVASLIESAPRLLLGWSAATALLTAALFFLKVSPEFSRVWLAVWFVSGLAVIIATRLAAGRLLQAWGPGRAPLPARRGHRRRPALPQPDQTARERQRHRPAHLRDLRRPLLGINPQDESFLDRDVWDIEATPPEKFPLLLHYHPLVIYRYQVIKQADIVLAMFLLGNEFTAEQKRRNFDYYDPLTTGDSSLSAAVQSIVAAEIDHPDRALEYFVYALMMDLGDVAGNASDGVHVAATGGVWMALVFGFAGVRDFDGELTFDPHLPAPWAELTIPIRFRDRQLRVTLTHDEERYLLEEGEPLSIEIRGQPHTVEVGSPVIVEPGLISRRYPFCTGLNSRLDTTLSATSNQTMSDSSQIPATTANVDWSSSSSTQIRYCAPAVNRRSNPASDVPASPQKEVPSPHEFSWMSTTETRRSPSVVSPAFSSAGPAVVKSSHWS